MLKVYITLDENGEITGVYEDISKIENTIQLENGEEETVEYILPHVEKLMTASAETAYKNGAIPSEFKIIGERLVHTETYEREWAYYAPKRETARNERLADEIRRKRDKMLVVLDRATWFYTLTEAQKADAVIYRKQLLDAPQMGKLPMRPPWLNEDGSTK